MNYRTVIFDTENEDMFYTCTCIGFVMQKAFIPSNNLHLKSGVLKDNNASVVIGTIFRVSSLYKDSSLLDGSTSSFIWIYLSNIRSPAELNTEKNVIFETVLRCYH